MNQDYNLDELEDEILDEIKLVEEKEGELLQQEKDELIERNGDDNDNSISNINDNNGYEIKRLQNQKQQQQQNVNDVIIKGNRKTDYNMFKDKIVNQYENILSSNREIGSLFPTKNGEVQLLQAQLIAQDGDHNDVNNYHDDNSMMNGDDTEKMNLINNENDNREIFPINNIDELTKIVSRIVNKKSFFKYPTNK